MKRTLLATLLVLSTALHADWSVTSSSPIHVAHTNARANHWIAVVIDERNDCSNFLFSATLKINDPDIFATPGINADNANVTLWVDGKRVQTFHRGVYNASEVKYGVQSLSLTVRLSLDSALALSTGREAAVQTGDTDPLEYDLTGSKAAITQAVISCYTAIGRNTTIYPQPHIIIP